MVVVTTKKKGPRKPNGYKVAPCNRLELRSIATQCVELLRQEGCYSRRGTDCLDAEHLLEDVLHRAGYTLHVADEESLEETAAFTVPDERLIVMRCDVYDGLSSDDPFARYTVVHEFGHIVLKHAISLHRGASLGTHQWYEDSEWQANNVAAEIMMPVPVVKRTGGRALLLQAECGVSAQAANFRIKNLREEGVL